MRNYLYTMAAMVATSSLYTIFLYHSGLTTFSNDDKIDFNTENNGLAEWSWNKPRKLGKITQIPWSIGEPLCDGRYYGWQFFSDQKYIHKSGEISCHVIENEDGFYVQENSIGFNFREQLDSIKNFFESKIFDSKLVEQIKVNNLYNPQGELITFGFEAPKDASGFSIMDEILKRVDKAIPKFPSSCLLVKPICDLKKFLLEYTEAAQSTSLPLTQSLSY